MCGNKQLSRQDMSIRDMVLCAPYDMHADTKHILEATR